MSQAENTLAPVSAEKALSMLKEGNALHLKAAKNSGSVAPELRASLVENGQHPYAVVVACADSRVVPEHMFSAGLGELFTIRVAGNVVGPTQAASVAYATGHLGTNLVVVLGHTHCGAVGAVLEGGAHGCVCAVTDAIAEAIGDERDAYAACVANVNAGVARLRDEPEIAELMEARGLQVVGAVHHTDTGEVEWL